MRPDLCKSMRHKEWEDKREYRGQRLQRQERERDQETERIRGRVNETKSDP